jgi:hypothetical protein
VFSAEEKFYEDAAMTIRNREHIGSPLVLTIPTTFYFGKDVGRVTR